jgi:hypothetical protein
MTPEEPDPYPVTALAQDCLTGLLLALVIVTVLAAAIAITVT